MNKEENSKIFFYWSFKESFRVSKITVTKYRTIPSPSEKEKADIPALLMKRE